MQSARRNTYYLETLSHHNPEGFDHTEMNNNEGYS